MNPFEFGSYIADAQRRTGQHALGTSAGAQAAQREPLGSQWLPAAQDFMLDLATFAERREIGKIYSTCSCCPKTSTVISPGSIQTIV